MGPPPTSKFANATPPRPGSLSPNPMSDDGAVNKHIEADSHVERNPRSKVFVYDMKGDRKIKMPRGELYAKVGETNIKKIPIKRGKSRYHLENQSVVIKIPCAIQVKRWIGRFDTLYVVSVA